MAEPLISDLRVPAGRESGARNSMIRTALTIAGTICFILAIVYIADVFRQNWDTIKNQDWSAVHCPWLAAAAITYGASLITTAMAWPEIIRKWGNKIPVSKALGIGLVAQIGKYLPGNVAHYFGRAALAKQQSVSFTQSGLSTMIEFGSAVIAALIVAIGAGLFDPSIFSGFASAVPLPGDAAIAFVIIAATLAIAIALIAWRRSEQVRSLLMPSHWLLPVSWLVVSFLLAGFSFYALALALGGGAPLALLPAIAIYAIAWAAGFLIPGAPAGLGVREVILLALLTPIMGAAAAIICSLAHRLLSALVDAIVAGGGMMLFLKKGQSHAG